MGEEAPDAPPRIPTQNDLISVCRSLNEHGARYLVVGGFAIIHHGCVRATDDIDLLVEESIENQARVKAALTVLPEKAILELGDDDLRNYVVVRVADEVMVDLMLAACGIKFDEALPEVRVVTIKGVPIPFASPKLLLRMKQTHRAKDAEDRIFLHQRIAEEEEKEGSE